MSHISRSKLFLSLGGLVFSLLALVGIQRVLAASVYNVVEETGTVGTSGTFELEYTVDTSQQTWANGDTITVLIPANLRTPSLSFTAEYDTDTTNDGVGETAIAAGSSLGQYLVTSNQLITIKWSIMGWGAVVNNSSTVRILLTMTPTYEDTASAFTFGGTTANGGDINPSGTDTVNIAAGDAAASMTLSTNSVVGVSGNSTLSFNMAIRMTADDTLVFTMPTHLSVSSAAFSSETFTGAGTFTACNAVGQVITCLANGAVGPGLGDLVLTGVTSRYAATGQVITSFVVNDNDSSGADIVRDDSVSVTDATPGALLEADVQPLVGIYLAESLHRILFTSSVVIPQAGKIQVIYPSGFDISGAHGKMARNLSGLDGTWMASVSGQTLTFVQTDGTASTAGVKILAIPGIIAPSTYAGGAYQMMTRTGANAIIEQDLTVEEDIFLPGTKNQEVSLGATTALALALNEEGYPVLTWVDPSANFSFAIDIFKQAHPEAAYYFGRVNSGVQSYTDSTVLPGQTISYFLRASHPDGTGPFSEILTVVIPTNNQETEVISEEILVDEIDENQENTSEEIIVEENVEEILDEDTVEQVSVFQDIEDHSARDTIGSLAEAGVLLGNPDGNFMPDAYINKAEMAAILHRLLSSPSSSLVESPYTDVLNDSWYFTPIAYLYESGYLDSSLAVYQPNRSMTRNEFMLSIAAIEDTLNVDIETICSLEWCTGEELLTRAQAAEVIHQIFGATQSVQVQ